MDELKPSKEIWEYYDRTGGGQGITIDLVVSSISDLIAGYAISYSARELLKDLGLLTKSGKPSKEAKKIVCHQLHDKYHRGVNGVKIVSPTECKLSVEEDQ